MKIFFPSLRSPLAKGHVQTYWLSTKKGKMGSTMDFEDEFEEMSNRCSSIADSDLWGDEESVADLIVESDNSANVVEWNVQSLVELLKLIEVRRQTKRTSMLRRSSSFDEPANPNSAKTKSGTTPLYEVREVISLPKFDVDASSQVADLDNVEIAKEAIDQLRHYLTQISKLYRNNHFHNVSASMGSIIRDSKQSSSHICHLYPLSSSLITRAMSPWLCISF